MGQYYKKTKIGTCENMYYMRLETAQILAEAGARDDDGVLFSDYINDNTTRFRFPWPDEDGRSKTNQLHNVDDFERGFSMPVPAHIQINHSTICVSNTPKNVPGHNVNLILPCPHSEDWRELEAAGARMSHGGAGQQYINVQYDAIRDGKRVILFSCARCGQLQRASAEDWATIVEHAREHFARQYHLVSDRERANTELVANNKRELEKINAILARM